VFEDLLDGLGPGEGMVAFVPAIDEGPDGGDEVLALVKLPRRMAWRVMIPKKIPTTFNQDPLVGVKCRVIRGLRAAARAVFAPLTHGVSYGDHMVDEAHPHSAELRCGQRGLTKTGG
jgi:hypothetical protein